MAKKSKKREGSGQSDTVKFKKFTASVKNIDIKAAKELLGWEEGSEDEPLEAGDRVYSINGRNVRLTNNLANRPLRKGSVENYTTEIVRGKWRVNGEPIILNKFGGLEDGQHRLVALVVANEMFADDPEACPIEGPYVLETVVVAGIEASDEVTNTINTGQKRSLGDVFFRNGELADLEPGKQKTITNILAQAVRLVWLRCGGKKVSTAPKLPVSEAVDFLNRHPQLRQSVIFIYNLNGGSGAQDGNRIKRHMSLSYAAGLHYLMSIRTTEAGDYVDSGKVLREETEWADQFFTALANDELKAEEDPIVKCLQNLLRNAHASTGADRDYLVALVIRAYNYWYDNAEEDGMTPKSVQRHIRPKTEKVTRSGREVKVAVNEFLGGLDIDWEEWYEENFGEEELEEYDDGEDVEYEEEGEVADGDEEETEEYDEEEIDEEELVDA